VPVHVLVPAYGHSPFLADTLHSVVIAAGEQTKVTVIDDGTPGPEVRTVIAAFDQVEYVRSASNRGVAATFQECIERSIGDYTVIMGSDDLMEPWYFEEINEVATALAEPATILPGVTVIDSRGRVTRPLGDRVKGWLTPRGPSRLLDGEPLATRLLVGNWLYFPAMACPTDALRRYGFRQDLATVLDLDLELRMVLAGEQLGWAPRRSFRYRRHADSASRRTAADGGRLEEEADVFRWTASEAREMGWRRAAMAAQWHPTSRLHEALRRFATSLPGASNASSDA
jgi:glycosyltransferase involved in cell wall biosynthesis